MTGSKEYRRYYPDFKTLINPNSTLESMILGRISGKIGTNEFTFIVEGNAKKFDYVQVYHRDYEYVLCQIVEIERKETVTTARCNVIGYLDGSTVKQIRVPFEPDTEVRRSSVLRARTAHI